MTLPSEVLVLPETDTMRRFKANQAKAKTNERKGCKGGDCNITQCQEPGASSYNKAMRAYYCQEHAERINESNRRHHEEELCEVNPDYHFDYEPKSPEHVPERSANSDTIPTVRANHIGGPKTGRNEPCPCDSGKKYKKCCI